MAEIYKIGEDGNNNSVPAWLPYVNNGNGLMNGNGWGGGILGFLLGLMFGNGGFGNGVFGGGASNAANTQLLSNAQQYLHEAIVNGGQRSVDAVQNLATTLGQNYTAVSGAVQQINTSLGQLTAQTGLSAQQIINSIQSGNAVLLSQFQQCCCQNQLENAKNTAALQQSIGDVKGAIGAMGAADTLAVCQQTNTLTTQAERNYNGIVSAIKDQTIAMNEQFCALKERELQAKINTQADIITQLRGQQDNAQQTSQILAYLNSIVTPLQNKVNEIAAKQLPTVNVQYPNITAVNTTPYTGGLYGNGIAPTFNF